MFQKAGSRGVQGLQRQLKKRCMESKGKEKRKKRKKQRGDATRRSGHLNVQAPKPGEKIGPKQTEP